MPLKDLIAQKAVLREEAIEEIVSEYVRYDPTEKTIILTPEADRLSIRAKVLVYLVALQGWRFVCDEEVPPDAKPADIEEHVGIKGGSLRPTLKELKDRNVIDERGGRYFVREASLGTIKTELGGCDSGDGGGTASPTARRLRRRRRRGRSSASAAENVQDRGGEVKDDAKFRRKRLSGNLSERFDTWIQEGFFDKPKTLSAVKDRFHKAGLIVPSTSVPQYLLRAIRHDLLERDKETVDGKEVWVYRTGSKRR